MRFRLAGLFLIKIAAIGVCLCSYFVTFGVTCCVPGGEFPERLCHFAVLLGISLLVTAVTGILFWKTRSSSANPKRAI
jgi:hypothetical protein